MELIHLRRCTQLGELLSFLVWCVGVSKHIYAKLEGSFVKKKKMFYASSITNGVIINIVFQDEGWHWSTTLTVSFE